MARPGTKHLSMYKVTAEPAAERERRNASRFVLPTGARFGNVSGISHFAQIPPCCSRCPGFTPTGRATKRAMSTKRKASGGGASGNVVPGNGSKRKVRFRKQDDSEGVCVTEIHSLPTSTRCGTQPTPRPLNESCGRTCRREGR